LTNLIKEGNIDAHIYMNTLECNGNGVNYVFLPFYKSSGRSESNLFILKKVKKTEAEQDVHP